MHAVHWLCVLSSVLGTDDVAVTYSKHVVPILFRRCVTCHRTGEVAPFAMTSFDETVGWAETIREVVEQRRMPPWLASPEHGSFANDARLSDEELATIIRWVDAGAPEGNPADLPPLPKFAQGWRIPEPDLVLELPGPFTVPASGTVQYQYFTIDPGFTEDTWVSAAEARPGNRSVVHHIVLLVQAPTDRPVRQTGGLGAELLATFAPGMPPTILPDGLAKLVPAGSKLVFQVHYTPNGSVQTDQSKAGLVLAEPKSVRKRVQGAMAVNFQFQIPPGANEHPVKAEYRFAQDSLLVSLFPHMHLRGKSFRFDAEYPDGRRETLLDVPRYDFNWQNQYVLTEPKVMPEGTRLLCTGHFDNSAENPANPNPNVTVRFGEQTWEEMMVGYFDSVVKDQDLARGGPTVRPGDGGKFEVQFRYVPKEPAQAVYLAGTFNEWNPTGHRMDGPDSDGRFSTRITLPAGEHEYKFVVDGTKWRQDPGNPRHTGFYNNSVLKLAGEQPAATVHSTPLDIQPKANQELNKDFSSITNGNNLAELPTGDQVLLGVKFHIGPGMIALGSPIKSDKPARVDGLKVGSQFTKLHILHATEFGESPEGSDRHVPEGTQIGQYTVHYEDGTKEQIPIVYGEDVRDWWFNAGSKGTTRGKVAWKGSNGFANSLASQLRLYLTTWQNPKPGVRVTQIDFSSKQTPAAPFCVAISAETQ
jgi:hypothetical protein